jgi:D-alanyl-lipoteichoic acid acyltransferase DltB (MBOAT superfamily)
MSCKEMGKKPQRTPSLVMFEVRESPWPVSCWLFRCRYKLHQTMALMKVGFCLFIFYLLFGDKLQKTTINAMWGILLVCWGKNNNKNKILPSFFIFLSFFVVMLFSLFENNCLNFEKKKHQTISFLINDLNMSSCALSQGKRELNIKS